MSDNLKHRGFSTEEIEIMQANSLMKKSAEFVGWNWNDFLLEYSRGIENDNLSD